MLCLETSVLFGLVNFVLFLCLVLYLTSHVLCLVICLASCLVLLSGLVLVVLSCGLSCGCGCVVLCCVAFVLSISSLASSSCLAEGLYYLPEINNRTARNKITWMRVIQKSSLT
jgi:hypothetical protein